jgi:hypothetical protein
MRKADGWGFTEEQGLPILFMLRGVAFILAVLNAIMLVTVISGEAVWVPPWGA